MVYINVCDAVQPNTFLTRRWREFKAGEKQNIYVQMPLTGRAIVVSIFENPNEPNANVSFSVDVSRCRLKSLPRQMQVVGLIDPLKKEWIKFIGQFAFNAGWLPCNKEGECYQSSRKNFQINYSATLTDEQSGVVSITPMRIDRFTEIIEISQVKTIPLTVPGRFVLGAHEVAHLFENKKMDDEAESDLNAVKVCLGLGFPPFDIRETYYNVFGGVSGLDAANDEELLKRLHAIDSYMEKYNLLNR